MSQPRDDRQDDLFRPPLEKIIGSPGRWIGFSGAALQFGLSGGAGQPPLPTKHSLNKDLRRESVPHSGVISEPPHLLQTRLVPHRPSARGLVPKPS
jgi:hypothetical protein